jgi:hypothetical protein
MKEKFWGLKKDEVDRLIRKKEREFQFELQKLEFELITLKKENDSLNEQINQEEKKQISLSINDPYWQLANNRIKTVLSMLNSQKDSEMILLKEASNARMAKLQQEINILDREIQSINQTIGQFLLQLDKQTEQNDPFIVQKEEVEEENVVVNLLETITQDDSSDGYQEEISKLEINQSDSSIKQLDENNPAFNLTKEVSEELSETEIQTPKNRLLEQISSFKEQYIIGKVAGADLFDLSGKQIIAINTKITKEIVEIANANGKLAELIVNMKILGAGEE